MPPLTLDTPIATPAGTAWQVRAFRFSGVEAGAPEVELHLELVEAGGAVLQTRVGTLTDVPAFVQLFNGVSAPNRAAALRRALLQRAAADGLIGTGTAT